MADTVYYEYVHRGSLRQIIWDFATTANYFRKRLFSVPPHMTPAMKRMVLRKYAKGLNVFVESGTYLGDAVHAMRKMRKVYSVEFQPELYLKACERFKGQSNIDLRCGDSATVLPEILSEITEPALFWLDGHFPSGAGENCCPTFTELKAILNHPVKGHVILIDDAREFTGQSGYPTIREIKRYAVSHGRKFEVCNDIMRIT